ncbi:MAG TPA: ChaN family lipoprotein [Kofleriaceae bacterium]|nr:ChaN family lipoprotein [Kofleriaceae bacterium]
MSTLRALLAVVVVAGCGGRYSGTSKPTTPSQPEAALPKGDLDAAKLPYQILERKGTQIDEEAFWTRLSKARAVCVGEEHPNPHHHWVQLHVVRELGKRLGKDGKLALGLEMVQKPFQGPLDDYAAKRIDAETMRSRTGWEDRWGYDYSFYGPTFDAAIAVGGQLLALNAPKELVKKVSRQGLESLAPDEKAQVPELKLDDAAHRAWFDNLMAEMGGASAHSSKGSDDNPHKKDDKNGAPDPNASKDKPANPHTGGAPAMPSADRIYTVQVLWDETMADGSAKWLKAHPNGKLVILAGNGHCHDTAIVNRLKRRGIDDVVSIRAVIDDKEGSVADVMAKPMNDFVVVLQLPKQAAAK